MTFFSLKNQVNVASKSNKQKQNACATLKKRGHLILFSSCRLFLCTGAPSERLRHRPAAASQPAHHGRLQRRLRAA